MNSSIDTAMTTGSTVRRLTDLERSLMDALWDRGHPATAREITADISARGLAYTTVKTLLDRLVDKQLLTRALDGRAFRYTPVASRDAYIAELMLDALEFTGDRSSALAHFARAVSKRDATALREALSNPGRRTQR